MLYDSEDYAPADPDNFWGLRYAGARILGPAKDSVDYAEESTLPSKMLFCLHHRLVYSHQHERPVIEGLVVRQAATGDDRFRLLGAECGLTPDGLLKPYGKTLLDFLYSVDYNLVHFACHCRTGKAGDLLAVSYIHDEQAIDKSPLIEIEVRLFQLTTKSFRGQPLVFLNACQSAGQPDELRRTFNLPELFMQRGAAAVIATACPVPDVFAAAFARVFYEKFLREYLSIGEALRQTRRHFLDEYNDPLGLAYGLYSPAHFQLAHALPAGG